MEIGLFHSVQWPKGTSQQERYSEAVLQAEYAEELGFSSVWFTEHHFSRHGIVSDSLALLAFLAGRTSKVRLGTAVSVLPLHDPVRLAESAATVDQLSGGRLDLGVGRGYQRGEFSGFGLDIADKADRFDEASEVLLRSWSSTEPFSHHGHSWHYTDADPQPKPVQQPHPPIWYATDSEDGFARCIDADWGVLLPQGRGLGTVAEQIGRLAGVYEQRGRQVDTSKVYLARALFVADSDKEAWATVEQPYRQFVGLAQALADPSKRVTSADGPFAADGPVEDSVIFGDPETCIAMLRKIRDLGVERVMLFAHIGGLGHASIMRSLGLFGKEVMPAVREL